MIGKEGDAMFEIRPVSDLRNKFPEVEAALYERGPIIFTKNGYGKMVLISLEEYSRLVDSLEAALDKADRIAETNPERLTHEQVFRGLKK